jgi:hypothetical protein
MKVVAIRQRVRGQGGDECCVTVIRRCQTCVFDNLALVLSPVVVRGNNLLRSMKVESRYLAQACRAAAAQS